MRQKVVQAEESKDVIIRAELAALVTETVRKLELIEKEMRIKKEGDNKKSVGYLKMLFFKDKETKCMVRAVGGAVRRMRDICDDFCKLLD